MTGGQDTAVLLCSVPALSAGLGDTAPAAVQPLVAYRCLPSGDHTYVCNHGGMHRLLRLGICQLHRPATIQCSCLHITGDLAAQVIVCHLG